VSSTSPSGETSTTPTSTILSWPPGNSPVASTSTTAYPAMAFSPC